MASQFLLKVEAPATSVSAAKTYRITPESGLVQQLEVERVKDKGRASNLRCTLSDKDWQLFGALPDPTYLDVPVSLYLPEIGKPQSVTRLVFQGKMTMLGAGYPGPQKMQIVAHDNSIDARRRKLHRVLSNLSSTKLAEAILKEYGLEVEIVNGAITPKTTVSHFGPGLSDWDLVHRALRADGLYVSVKGKKVSIRSTEFIAYSTIFKRGEPPIISFDVQIEHIRGAGAGGDNKSRVPVDVDNIIGATTDPFTIAEFAKASAENITSRRPVRSPLKSSRGRTGDHTEDLGDVGLQNTVFKKRHNKDSANLTVYALNDVELYHTVTLSGWGGKVDGSWYIEAITDTFVGSGPAQTMLKLHRQASPGAAKLAGFAWSS